MGILAHFASDQVPRGISPGVNRLLEWFLAMSSNSQRVRIIESYRDYTPPVPIKRTVQDLIDAIPAKYIAGLHSIVLRNAGGLNHEQRRERTHSRGRRVAIRACLGLYHQKWKGEPAWIELFVDSILKDQSGFLLRIPLTRRLVVAPILYHEIGHHIHFTKAPQHREPEDVADKWRDSLCSMYLRRRYWYMRPMMVASRWIVSMVVPQRIRRRVTELGRAGEPPR